MTGVTLFCRQAVAELRKVVWPTRRELVAYSLTAIAFLILMGVLVGTSDFVLGKVVLALFG